MVTFFRKPCAVAVGLNRGQGWLLMCGLLAALAGSATAQPNIPGSPFRLAPANQPPRPAVPAAPTPAPTPAPAAVTGAGTFATPPPFHDPLLNLMMAQPKLDVSSPVVASAVFDPPVVRPGEPAFYRVALNALEDTMSWPPAFDAPAGLRLEPRGRGQVFQIAASMMQPRAAFNYHALAQNPGRFTIPEYVIRANGQDVKVPAATLEVRPNPPSTVAPGQILVLDLAQTNLFLGQSVRCAIRLPGQPGGIVQGLTQVKVEGNGLVTDQASAVQRIETRPSGGVPVASYVYEVSVTPLQTGELSVFAQGFAVGNRFGGPIVISGPVTIPGGAPLYTLLDSDPRRIRVRPLPTTGMLPGFTGAVGVYHVGTPVITTNVLRVGEPVRFSVQVRGTDGLARLVAPPPPQIPDWQVFPVAPGAPPPPGVNSPGFTTFNYTLIPMREGRQMTPPIPFCRLDPVTESYVDISIPGLEVTVEPGQAVADLETLAQAARVEEVEEQKLALSGLTGSTGLATGSLVPMQQQAWFPWVQAAPAVLFLGLWSWDRRRRFLEKHPEVIRCRRARRALRRQRRILRQAQQRRDPAAFASAAVSALRIACAPYYPAEPRALVSADILAVMEESERVGPPGAVVRRVFDAYNAREFAEGENGLETVLESAPALEQVLARLEEKL